MDPVVLPLDPQGGLIHVQRGLAEDLLDGGLLPGRQGLVQLHHILEDRRLGDEPIDQRMDRLLNPLQGEHLGEEQIQDIGLDAGAVLQGTAIDPGGIPPSFAPRHWGQRLISASTWLTTFSKTMSIRVRRSYPLEGMRLRSSPQVPQACTGMTSTVSTVRVFSLRLW